MSELQEHTERADQIHQQIDAFYEWSMRQSADLRAKAEVADELDDEDIEDMDSLPGDGGELREAAGTVESVFHRLRKLEA